MGCGSNLNSAENTGSPLQQCRQSNLEAQMDAMKGTVEARRLQHVTRRVGSKLVVGRCHSVPSVPHPSRIFEHF